MLGRKPKLPAELRPALDRDERVLAWAMAGDAAVAVATNRGLWLPGRDRLGWHEIHKVIWGEGRMVVVPAQAAPGDDFTVVADLTPVAVTLNDPGDLPRRVRDRVTASVAYSSRYPLPGGGAARVVARRVSGRDGLSWSVRYEDGADPAGPGVREATGELVAAARASLSQPD
jgi:hypothetical protein